MRAFIAFPLSDEAKQELVKTQAEINGQNLSAKIRWVEDKNMHVTVEFLGDVKEEQVEHIKNILNNICIQHKPFEYKLKKVNAFPNLEHPNVLVVDIGDDERNSSVNLYVELHNELAKIGLNLNNRKWYPHATLGRIKPDFSGKISLDNISVQETKWIVDEVLFIKSDLTPAGPVYEVIETFKLNS
ncbi:MAG: RNA 2',3'-cyclic phosphodiesterase [Patescibacteria group bacterium]